MARMYAYERADHIEKLWVNNMTITIDKEKKSMIGSRALCNDCENEFQVEAGKEDKLICCPYCCSKVK